MSDLSKTATALAALSVSADRLIAQAQGDAAALAAANQTIATLDADTASQVDAITAKIDAAAPPSDAAAPATSMTGTGDTLNLSGADTSAAPSE